MPKKYEERTYLAWVLIYDEMVYLPNIPCDVGYEICLKIADIFLRSSENDPSKPLYDAFWDWFNRHREETNRFVRTQVEKYKEA